MKLLAYISFLVPLAMWGQQNLELDESFDPTSLNDWPDSRARIEQITSLKAYYEGIGNQIDTVEIVEHSDFVFRVQLGSTTDYDRAILIEEGAAENFDDEIVLQFDSPYYKIRVGRMDNREDAQNLQQYAIQKGYRRAWVIRTENTLAQEN